MMEIICANCGRTKAEHCDSFVRKMPDWCKCEPESWGYDMTPVCAKYVRSGGAWSYCKTCEHNKECHDDR